MNDIRIALVTGANQGVGFQVAKELVANGVTVYLGARNFKHGEAAAVAALVREHLEGRRDNRKQLWTLFAFELWHDGYLARSS
jgi:NAD(P)-dependent dehydrogenase (short-subunit alcohol dehydrogenase family)